MIDQPETAAQARPRTHYSVSDSATPFIYFYFVSNFAVNGRKNDSMKKWKEEYNAKLVEEICQRMLRHVDQTNGTILENSV